MTDHDPDALAAAEMLSIAAAVPADARRPMLVALLYVEAATADVHPQDLLRELADRPEWAVDWPVEQMRIARHVRNVQRLWRAVVIRERRVRHG